MGIKHTQGYAVAYLFKGHAIYTKGAIFRVTKIIKFILRAFFVF